MALLFKRSAGVALILLSSASLLVGLFALIQVWRLRIPMQAATANSLDLISATLETTSDALHVTELSLDAASSSLAALQSTVDSLESSIDDVSHLMTAIQGLAAQDLPGTIASLQRSLGVAQVGARVIDSVLRTLTIFNPELYNPSTPLHESLAQTSTGLDNLYTTFSTMDRSLGNTNQNLQGFKTKIERISADLQAMQSNLLEAKDLIISYQSKMERMQVGLERLKANLPLIFLAGSVGLSFIFLWLAVIQIWLLLKGWEMSFSKRSLPAEVNQQESV